MTLDEAMRRHPSMRAIWTADDFHAVVDDLRALAASKPPQTATVVDLFTREVIA